MVGFLDRQAAIDERYWKSQVDTLVSKGETLVDGNTWLWSEAAELQEKVDEQRKSLEAAWEDNAELITQVDELTQANGDLRDEWHRVCVERNKLISKLIESERDRESLRAKLGEAVDHAHEIGRLME